MTEPCWVVSVPPRLVDHLPVSRRPVVYRLKARTNPAYIGEWDEPVLYVGQSRDLVSRLYSHEKEKAWWGLVCCVDVALCESVDQAFVLEERDIYEQMPLFNTQMNHRVLNLQGEALAAYSRRYRGVDWEVDGLVHNSSVFPGRLDIREVGAYAGCELDEFLGVVSDEPFENARREVPGLVEDVLLGVHGRWDGLWQIQEAERLGYGDLWQVDVQ